MDICMPAQIGDGNSGTEPLKASKTPMGRTRLPEGQREKERGYRQLRTKQERLESWESHHEQTALDSQEGHHPSFFPVMPVSGTAG